MSEPDFSEEVVSICMDVRKEGMPHGTCRCPPPRPSKDHTREHSTQEGLCGLPEALEVLQCGVSWPVVGEAPIVREQQ